MATALIHFPEYILYLVLGALIGEILRQVIKPWTMKTPSDFKRDDYIELIDVATGLSPFVGLLGTVMALMSALQALGSPEKLAPVLGAALYTTALGIGTALVGAVLASGIRIATGKSSAHDAPVQPAIDE